MRFLEVPDDDSYLRHYIVSIMRHPERDPHDVFSLSDVITWSTEAGIDPTKIIKLIRNTNNSNHTKVDGNRIIHQGFISGYLILIPMAAYFTYNLDIGRQSAMGLIGSKRNMQLIWSRYKTVAHLWAAAIFCLNLQHSDGRQHSDDDEFLQIAWSIEKWATEFTPKRAQGTILDVSEIWSVPSRFAGRMPQELDRMVLPPNWIEKLKARNR